MEPKTLKTLLIQSDTMSDWIKQTIVKDELTKLVHQSETLVKETQKERWPGREPRGGLEMPQILEILDQTTGRYWIWVTEEEIFENHDLESLIKVIKECDDDSEIDDGFFKFGGTTLKMIQKDIIPSFESTSDSLDMVES